MTKVIISSTCCIIALISILAPFSIYYFSGFLQLLILFGCFITLLLSSRYNPIDVKNFKKSVLFLIIWVIVYFISMIVNSIYVPLINWLFVLYGFMFISLKDSIKKQSYNFFIRILSVLLFFSLIEYVIYIATGFSVISKIVKRGNGFILNNLLLNVVRVSSTPRFQFLSEEPGLIGTLCAFILFTIGNDKKYFFDRIVIWIAGLLSFSLAFYIIAILKLLLSKISFKTYIIVASIGFALSMIFKEQIEISIVNRLQKDEIDNRTTDSFNRILKETYDSGELFLGKGYNSHRTLTGENDGNAGAKVFILSYGILGTLLIFITYNKLLLYGCRRNRWEFIVFMFIFWLSFYQRQTIDRPYVIILVFAYNILYVDNNLITNRCKSK